MEGRMGAAHVGAQAVRAVALLVAHLDGKHFPDQEIADAIESLADLIEMANDGRIKVVLQFELEDPQCDDFADFDDPEGP